MKRWSVIIAAVVVAIACVTGCGAATDTGAVKTEGASLNLQPRENLKDGGSLTTVLPEVSAQWNTFHADGNVYTLALWRWYNPLLAYFTPDGRYLPNPDYLTDVRTEIVGRDTVVTYTVNPKAFFNDGTPIDYRAFVETWRTSRGVDDRYLVSSSDGYSQIASVTRGADDREVVVRFDGVYAWPDGLFNVVLHPKAAAPDVYNEGYVRKPHPEWGAGPFTIASYDADNGTVVFERNPKWWGKPGKLDRRIFRQMESQAALNAFQNGEIDATGVAAKDARARALTMNGIDIRTAAAPQQSLLVLNLDTPILSDRRVREAVLSAVDRETLSRIRFTGLNYTEELPGSLSLYPFQPGYEDNLSKVLSYDPAKAEELLDRAGWLKGGDGIRSKDGRRLSLELPNIGDDTTTQNLSRALQAILKKVGVDLTVRQRPSADFSQVVVNKEFDLLLLGFSSSDPFGMAYFCQVWCTGSQLNPAGAGSPELDAQIDAMSRIGDPMAQIKAGNELEREAFAQFSNLPLFNGPSMVAVKEGLANYGAGQFYVGPIEDVGWEK
ncbi:putative peptide ABC transporter substrate-binding protein [Gordonia namibiensis NBRC 108229]|uniref:Putative peptide ABC transporter substrate-binding protein n=1 Tax=Gordonia namibiensis NBRC 108229 TaxID=1208314 RepID=K6XNS4_9ACTN|nr:ABC transporter family substrate-binding protein [Gordonia namibiensis]GAC00490.1 putative peptide ABC transporter substrate-binding protein [Gordonia namibiensis NBRC 108229]